MNKIKIDVTTIIEDEETGKKTKKQKTMSLRAFADMVDRDSPSEFDGVCECGGDNDFYYVLLGMLIIEKEIKYEVTDDETGNEKSVIAKLVTCIDRNEVLALL